jgi:hypothetical protein
VARGTVLDERFGLGLCGALIGLYWKVIGWFLLLMVVLVAYLTLGVFSLASMSGLPLKTYLRQALLSHSFAVYGPLLAMAGVGYLAFVLSLNVVMRIYLLRDLWVRVISSTLLHGIDAAANVAARGELANALGEGFADGLDVAGF